MNGSGQPKTVFLGGIVRFVIWYVRIDPDSNFLKNISHCISWYTIVYRETESCIMCAAKGWLQAAQVIYNLLSSMCRNCFFLGKCEIWVLVCQDRSWWSFWVVVGNIQSNAIFGNATILHDAISFSIKESNNWHIGSNQLILVLCFVLGRFGHGH